MEEIVATWSQILQMGNWLVVIWGWNDKIVALEKTT